MKDTIKLSERMIIPHAELIVKDYKKFEEIVEPQFLYRITLKDSYIKSGDITMFYQGLVSETTCSSCDHFSIDNPDVIPKHIVVFAPTMLDLVSRNFNRDVMGYFSYETSEYDEISFNVECDFDSVYNKENRTLYLPLTLLVPFSSDLRMTGYIKSYLFIENISTFALLSDIFRDTNYIVETKQVMNQQAHSFLDGIMMTNPSLNKAIDNCAFMTDSRYKFFRDISLNKDLKYNSIVSVVQNIADTITPKSMIVGKVGESHGEILRNIANKSPFINHVSNAILSMSKFLKKYNHMENLRKDHMWELEPFLDVKQPLDKYIKDIHHAYFGDNYNVTLDDVIKKLQDDYEVYGIKSKLVNLCISHKVEVPFIKYGDSSDYVSDVCADMFTLVKYAEFIKESLLEFSTKYTERINEIDEYLTEVNCLDYNKGKLIYIRSMLHRLSEYVSKNETEDLFISLRDMFLSGINVKSIVDMHYNIREIFALTPSTKEDIEDIGWYDFRLGSTPQGSQNYIGVILSNIFQNELNIIVEENEYINEETYLKSIIE